MDSEEIAKELMLIIFQLVAIYKALLMGWNVRMLGPKRYELSQPYVKNVYDDLDLNEFIMRLVANRPNY